MRANQKPRRRYSDEFKAQVVAACAEPEASVSAVALSFGLNANLVRQWQRGRGYKANQAPAAESTKQAPPQFVALSLPAPALTAPSAGVRAAPAEAIRVELKRGALVVSVSWPSSAAAQCAALVRELLR